MQLVTFKIFASISIFFISLVAGLFQINIAKNQSHLLCLCDSFASGIFLSVALLHLLPEADKIFVYILGSGSYPAAQLICLASFILLLTIERGLFLRGKHYQLSNNKTVTPSLLILFLSIHSLVEGAAIGTSTNFIEAIMLFFAVLAHKGSESFALATNLHRHNIATKKIQQTIAIFSLATPLGIFIASLVIYTLHTTQQANLLNSTFNSIAAGTFLYLGTEHFIKCKKSFETFNELIALTLGMALMALVAIWV